MKIEYDKEADAAYIYLKHPIKDGESKDTIELDNNVVIDLDEKGNVLGIEVLFVKERGINLEKLKETKLAPA